LHLEIDVREALGLSYNPDPHVIMAALLRDGRVSSPPFSVLPRIEDWFGDLANALTGFTSEGAPSPSPTALNEVADRVVGSLHASLAPTVLAILAPASTVRCAARDLPSHTKRQVKAELPAFCARVVARWSSGELSPNQDAST
jgi:hypothetical protein